VNFKDKLFTTSGLVFLGALTGLLFPKVITYLLWLALLAGLGGITYWVWKETKG